MNKTLAIIPARAGSKRVPGKNTRIFAGKPLIQWTLEFALNYKGFDEVVISTDCVEVAKIASACGKSLPWMRPAELAGDEARTIDVALHALSEYAKEGLVFERIAILQPTTPFRKVSRWLEAERLLDKGALAVVGVNVAEQHPYWTYWVDSSGAMRPCFPEQSQFRSQELPHAATINGALYWLDVDVMKRSQSFTPDGVHAVFFEDAIETIDIDTEQDWISAEQAFLRLGLA